MENRLPGAVGGQPPDSICHDPQRPQTPPAGKLRRTALRFFAGRKSICMLPSFFVGKGKGQTRGLSKMGVSKSQTYDGVSRACWEDKGSGDMTSADFEFHNPNGPTGQLGKSQSLPRQKRGLRGLLSSIRKHRKNKNVELEKNEMFEMSSGETKPVTVPTPEGQEVRAGHVQEVHAEPVDSRSDFTDEMSTIKESSVSENQMSLKSVEEERGENQEKSGLVIYRQPLSAESEMSRLAELRNEMPKCELPTMSTSSDNLVFGDVSSLKSFDSLTGCGDIIADQDDVSIAESSVSGERGSRNATKRTSCLVTYQGGGEEMATPDEVDNEYLSSLWESEGSEVCYLPSEETISPDQPISSSQVTSSSGNTGTSLSGVTETDILTPQSDQQGSVPNSDEGYYESTTPGAEEEIRECPLQDRLPRDSYSGDALYELFEPDDRLLSPPLTLKDPRGFAGENKSKGDFLYALTSAALETGVMETEEERLSKIQHALLCCELQGLRNPSKDTLDCGESVYGDSASHDGKERSAAQEEGQQQNCRTHALTETPFNGGHLQHKNFYNPSDSRLASQTSSPLQDAGEYFEQEECDVSDDSPFPPTRGCGQSHEDLMVCFSQALVDFTKNSRRYRNSTESLDGSESSSPFGPSLSALPAIVTFDVVDMENEGECEQAELEEEQEVLSSPYEAFEDDECYLQQDAFAECDQRTLDAYERSLLLSNAWGIASLPRHLSYGRPHPPVPAPLALNRRSRSLDTDNLKFQSDELYSLDKATGSCQERKNSPETEECLSVAERGWMYSWESDSSSPQKHQRPLQDATQTKVPQNCTTGREALVRPSHLPVQAPYRSSVARVVTTSTDGDGSPIGGNYSYPCSYPPAGGHWKSHPATINQGIPHHRSDQSQAAREISAIDRWTDAELGSAVAQKRHK